MTARADLGDCRTFSQPNTVLAAFRKINFLVKGTSAERGDGWGLIVFVLNTLRVFCVFPLLNILTGVFSDLGVVVEPV